MVDVREILAEARKALQYSSSSLESVESYDDEDRDADGGSKACKACVKINKRAIAKIDAFLANAPATGEKP
jgi:hypothetical protein